MNFDEMIDSVTVVDESSYQFDVAVVDGNEEPAELPSHIANYDLSANSSGLHAESSEAKPHSTEACNRSDGALTDDNSDASKRLVREIRFPEAAERPCFCVYDHSGFNEDGDWVAAGVYFHGYKKGAARKPDEYSDIRICGSMHILAQTHDRMMNNFGRLLKFKNTADDWRIWAMPMRFLKSDGADLREHLLEMGLDINLKERNLLTAYLSRKAPKETCFCTKQVGWHGSEFVLPDRVIGPNASSVIYQGVERGAEEFGQSGTLEDWQRGIALLALGNPMLILGLSAAFAGPLLERTRTESGGLHFYAESSTGKTTILEAARSVWGGEAYKRSWRATTNGVEGAAVLFNDCLLVIDETSEAITKDVAAIVYSFGNNIGRMRADQTGGAKPVARWKGITLSSGERAIATTMEEEGLQMKAGQSVRLLDIPVTRRFGCFDELHHLGSGAELSDTLKRTAGTNYGVVGRSFLERLTSDSRDFSAEFQRIKDHSAFNPSRAEGQEKRAATRLALIAYAGELATEYGLTGWPQGAATEAAACAFELWRANRGEGNDERRQILDALASFLECHGDSRFAPMSCSDANLRDRAGWWEHDQNGDRVYLFTPKGLQGAIKGFDVKRYLEVLEDCGVIPKRKAGNRERAKTMRIGGQPVRVYTVFARKLGEIVS